MWFITYLPISFRVTSLALGQSYDCPSASEVTLKNMDKMICTKTQQNTTMPIFRGIYCNMDDAKIGLILAQIWLIMAYLQSYYEKLST